MGNKLPRLVIVSGPSAAGKSSIARALAGELGLPLLAKDDIKEGLFDSLGRPTDEDESIRFDAATFVLVERLGRRILESGTGLVVEGNFGRAQSEPILAPLAGRSRAAIVHCTIEPPAMVARIKKRIEGKKKRHPGHMDHDPDPDFVEQLKDPEKFVETRLDVEPPSLPLPIYRLDTTKDHNPKLGKVVKWIRKATSPPAD
jgi:predicted kinase